MYIWQPFNSLHGVCKFRLFNPWQFIDATSTNMKLVHWQLMGGLLHLVQQEGDWVGPQPAQAPPRCKKM